MRPPVPATASISAIVNGASYATGAVAPGEIVTVYGSSLGASTLVRGSFTNSKLATTLNRVQLTFDGVAAPLLYLQNGQLAAVLPFEVAGKTETSVQISGRGQQSTALKQTGAVAAASAAQKIAATVTYAGALPSSIRGMYRVDLLVPQATASGSVPLLITIGGAATQGKVTLTVE